jgi:hypothetical protein
VETIEERKARMEKQILEMGDKRLYESLELMEWDLRDFEVRIRQLECLPFTNTKDAKKWLRAARYVKKCRDEYRKKRGDKE